MKANSDFYRLTYIIEPGTDLECFDRRDYDTQEELLEDYETLKQLPYLASFQMSFVSWELPLD